MSTSAKTSLYLSLVASVKENGTRACVNRQDGTKQTHSGAGFFHGFHMAMENHSHMNYYHHLF